MGMKLMSLPPPVSMHTGEQARDTLLCPVSLQASGVLLAFPAHPLDLALYQPGYPVGERPVL